MVTEGDSCQTYQHKTDHVTPDSTRPPPWPYLHFLLPELPTSERSSNFLCIARPAHLVQSTVMGTGYYIKSRYIILNQKEIWGYEKVTLEV
jgi:hypothetical protein